MPEDNGNPFDRPLNSELEEHQQQQAATLQASSNGNPFDEPLASEKAEAAQAQSGQITNDVGNTVIVPREGESFADTMKRAAAYGKTVTQDQVNKELDTAPKKAAQVLAAAPTIGAVGSAALALPGELVDLAVKHLAGNVLPGMESQAARQVLAQAMPRAAQFVETMGKLGFGAAGVHYLVKAMMGEGKK